jgi:hypothetical protein
MALGRLCCVGRWFRRSATEWFFLLLQSPSEQPCLWLLCHLATPACVFPLNRPNVHTSSQPIDASQCAECFERAPWSGVQVCAGSCVVMCTAGSRLWLCGRVPLSCSRASVCSFVHDASRQLTQLLVWSLLQGMQPCASRGTCYCGWFCATGWLTQDSGPFTFIVMLP